MKLKTTQLVYFLCWWVQPCAISSIVLTFAVIPSPDFYKVKRKNNILVLLICTSCNRSSLVLTRYCITYCNSVLQLNLGTQMINKKQWKVSLRTELKYISDYRFEYILQKTSDLNSGYKRIWKKNISLLLSFGNDQNM